MKNLKKLITYSCLISGLALVLFIIRVLYTKNYTYLFLTWNLLLALIPFGISLILIAIEKARIKIRIIKTILTFVWLIFLPNTFYILTDFIHLRAHVEITIWFDLILISSFCFAGVYLGIVSLEIFNHLYLRSLSRSSKILINSAILVLCSYGIYLGRFLRWNSWDILYNPINLISDFVESLRYPQTYLFTILFTVLMGVIILGYRSFR